MGSGSGSEVREFQKPGADQKKPILKIGYVPEIKKTMHNLFCLSIRAKVGLKDEKGSNKSRETVPLIAYSMLDGEYLFAT